MAAKPLVMVLLILWLTPVTAQAQEQNGWSAPYQLSGIDAKASEGFMVSDPYGNVHVFWTEVNPADGRSVIMQALFDGQEWSKPLDIYTSPSNGQIGHVSPAVDANGNMHIAWTEGNSGPSYYSYAPATALVSARNWAKPVDLGAPAYQVWLQVDSSGVLHVVYSIFFGQQPGLYYIRSEDGGLTWTSPLWLDPDIPYGQVPNWMRFVLDDEDRLHVVWHYMSIVGAWTGQAVRYTHSLDGGDTWSPPFSIDEPDDTGVNLSMAHPSMMTSGQSVYVIWGNLKEGASATRRAFRFSSDAGRTWSERQWIMQDLEGEAAGAGFTVDSAGRVHYALQIRYPKAIWHTYWNGSQWSTPSIAYLIARDSTEDKLVEAEGMRIHAHNVRLATRAGNQLVMTFTSSPGEGPLVLYTMHKTLDDVPSIPVLQPPALTPTPTATPTAVLTSPLALALQRTQTPVVSWPDEAEINSPSVDTTRSPGYVLWWSLVPSVLMLCAAIAIRGTSRR